MKELGLIDAFLRIDEIKLRLDAIEKRHAEHDAGLRAMATETKTVDVSQPLPCPFYPCLGGGMPRHNIHGKIVIECRVCDAQGPSCESADEAIAAWNRAKR